MNINNLEIGMTFKNYKELCETLDIEIMQGNSKITQLKEIRRYIRLDKISGTQKFIINDIYNVSLDKVDIRQQGNNKMQDTEDIYLLILNHLAKCNEDIIFLSKSILYKALNMINNKYNHYKYNTKEMSEMYKIPEDDIVSYFMSSDSLLKRKITNALKMFDNKSVAKVNEIYVIVYASKDNRCNQSHIPTNHKESRLIYKSEYAVLELMGLKTKQEVIIKGVWNTFRNKVIEQLHTYDEDIQYYYKAYEFIFDKECICRENYKMDTENWLNKSHKINLDICNRLNINASKRYNRCKGDSNKYNVSYIKNHKKFTEIVIE